MSVRLPNCAREAALIGGEIGRVGPRIDRRAACQQGAGLGRPAVVGQRAELWIDESGGRADEVAIGVGRTDGRRR